MSLLIRFPDLRIIPYAYGPLNSLQIVHNDRNLFMSVTPIKQFVFIEFSLVGNFMKALIIEVVADLNENVNFALEALHI